MGNHWAFKSAIAGIVGGILTYLLTGSWQISLIAMVAIFVITWWYNPQTRYMRAFYVVLLPLIMNIYFTIDAKTENFDLKAGWKEVDIPTTLVLGLIAICCLFLDYLERNDKLGGSLLKANKNKVGKVEGNNINITQNINEKPSNENTRL